MTRKIQVGIIIGVVILAGVVAIVSSKPKEEKKIVNEVVPIVKPTEKAKEVYRYLTWEDGAGFRFDYPEGVKVDNHPEDEKNYANLTLTTGGGEGKIEILMADNSFKTIEAWAGKGALDTVFGGKDGKKMVLPDKMAVGVIDNEVLVTVSRSFSNNPILETTWAKIIDSWQFVYPTPATKQDDDANLVDVLEEE
jgi:hypothetical protein